MKDNVLLYTENNELYEDTKRSTENLYIDFLNNDGQHYVKTVPRKVSCFHAKKAYAEVEV